MTFGARFWASTPPRTRWKSSAFVDHRAVPTSTRIFFLRPTTASASAVNSGATMHSTNRLDTASAASASTGAVNEMTAPNAETGSHASALRYASIVDVPTASPHGV